MNKGEFVKRGLAWLLSVVMVSGVVHGTPGVVSEVQAATAGTPSVDTFATKSQLMNNFDLDGKKDTVGTITFGKNDSGKSRTGILLEKTARCREIMSYCLPNHRFWIMDRCLKMIVIQKRSTRLHGDVLIPQHPRRCIRIIMGQVTFGQNYRVC